MGSKYSKTTTSITDTSCLAPFESFRVPFVEDGFGNTYRGVLCNGTKASLKRRKPGSSQGFEDFRTEIEILSQFHHPHFISLIGYCDENDEMILFYEYMENGNLRSHLYGSDLPTLSWEQRLEICMGAASALHYLHSNGIIHRDVNSTNILLDENFVPKITDFGGSKTGIELDQTHVTTVVKGTFGYPDPEYFSVYSFGVVLFEVLCARPAIVRSLSRQMVGLATWVMETLKKEQLEQIIDPNLLGKIKPDSLRTFGETVVKIGHQWLM